MDLLVAVLYQRSDVKVSLEEIIVDVKEGEPFSHLTSIVLLDEDGGQESDDFADELIFSLITRFKAKGLVSSFDLR